jgi:hypothetical protein
MKETGPHFLACWQCVLRKSVQANCHSTSLFQCTGQDFAALLPTVASFTTLEIYFSHLVLRVLLLSSLDFAPMATLGKLGSMRSSDEPCCRRSVFKGDFCRVGLLGNGNSLLHVIMCAIVHPPPNTEKPIFLCFSVFLPTKEQKASWWAPAGLPTIHSTTTIRGFSRSTPARFFLIWQEHYTLTVSKKQKKATDNGLTRRLHFSPLPSSSSPATSFPLFYHSFDKGISKFLNAAA